MSGALNKATTLCAEGIAAKSSGDFTPEFPVAAPVTNALSVEARSSAPQELRPLRCLGQKRTFGFRSAHSFQQAPSDTTEKRLFPMRDSPMGRRNRTSDSSQPCMYVAPSKAAVSRAAHAGTLRGLPRRRP